MDGYINEYGLSKQNREGYLACRADYNDNDGKHPSQLYALITHSFNNQIRFNSKGQYNMPFGTDRSSFNPVLRQRFVDFSNRMRTLDLTFHGLSFMDAPLYAGSFVYCDPPYLISTATYNEKDGWTPDSERYLLSYLDMLTNSGIKWGLSNVTHHGGRTNDQLIEWSRYYNVHELNMTYSNASYQKKDRDSKSREVFITNY